MKHIGINAKVASHVFSLLALMGGTTVCFEIPLQSPPPPRETVTWRPSPPPPPGRPSRANPGVCKGGGGYHCGRRGQETPDTGPVREGEGIATVQRPFLGGNPDRARTVPAPPAHCKHQTPPTSLWVQCSTCSHSCTRGSVAFSVLHPGHKLHVS